MPAEGAPRGRVHATEVQMRFADTDALGHVNNASFALYVESARLDFFSRLGEQVRSLILAHLAIDFRRQVGFGERMRVDTTVDRVGTTSVALHQLVYADGGVAAEARSVVVLFDYAAQRPEPIGPAMRARLEPYLRAEAGTPT
jgi:acyl-CoA thioester hydrolase